MANRSQEGLITGFYEEGRVNKIASDSTNEGIHYPRVIVENVEGPLGPGQNNIGAVNGVTVDVVANPPVTASTYAVSKVIGGIIPFPNILPPKTFAGVLESITVKFGASAQTVGFWVSIFVAPPTGTFTDTSSAAIKISDSAILVGAYHLTVAMSLLGTHTIYNLDGLGKAIQGRSQTLYAVVVPDATTGSLASVDDMTVELGMLWG